MRSSQTAYQNGIDICSGFDSFFCAATLIAQEGLFTIVYSTMEYIIFDEIRQSCL